MSTLPRDPDSGARLRVLILEDNPDDAELVLRELRRGGFEPAWERVETAEDFSAALTHEWDIILTDFSMPHFNAFDALEILEGRQNAPPCIVVSGTIGEDTAVAAIKAGAADYLMKDRLARLAATVRRELRDQAVRRLHDAEQRRAQEAIQKLLTAIENTVDSIVMTDPDGRINYVNPGFQKLYGYSKEEVAGKTPRVLKSGKHDAAYYRAFWGSLISGAGFRGEVVNRTKDGRLVTAEMTASAIFDDSGKRTGYIAVHHDVTEKKRAEEKLRASEARLLAIIETEPECVKTIDRNGKISNMNRAGLAMLEADSLAELQRRDLLEFLLPEYRAPFTALHERVMKGESGSLEFEVTGLRGTRRWLDTHAAPLRDADGRVEGLLGIARDVTERKHAGEALRESEARFRGAFETSPIGMALVAPDGRWIQINHRLCEITGYSRQELLSRTFQDITHPDDLAKDLALVSQVLEGEIPFYQMEKRYIHKAGHSIWTHLTVALVRDPQGAPLHFVSQIEDITTRKSAEGDLKASEERFRELAENIQEVFWLTDPARNEMLYVSPAYETIWGRTCESLYASPRTWLDSIHPDDRKRVIEAVATKQTNGTYDEEYRIRRPDGEIRWIHDRAFAVRDSFGAVTRVVGVAVDVTGKRRAEDELRESQKQLRALSAHLQTIREDERTGIARELHDELGQSLTALKMDLASIRGMCAGGPDARKAAVQKIDAASQVADGMIHTVRRISSELRPGMLDDLGLFPAIEWLAQDFSQRTGISVRIASEIGSVALDRAQSTAIFRILQETLTNVARHSKATEVSGLVRESGGAFELEIRDNGKGFPLSILHEASSLGLIGMRERAGSVGGSIEFLSAPGDGTTVRLRVPLPGKNPS